MNKEDEKLPNLKNDKELKPIAIANDSEFDYLMIIDKAHNYEEMLFLVLFFVLLIVQIWIGYSTPIEDNPTKISTSLKEKTSNNFTLIPIKSFIILPKHRFVRMQCTFGLSNASAPINLRLAAILKLKGVKKGKEKIIENGKMLNVINLKTMQELTFDLLYLGNIKYTSLYGSLELNGDVTGLDSISIIFTTMPRKNVNMQCIEKIVFSVLLVISVGILTNSFLDKGVKKSYEQHYTTFLIYAAFIDVDFISLSSFVTPLSCVPLIHAVFASIYDGFAVFYMISIIANQGMSIKNNKNASEIGTLYGFVSFFHYMWEEIRNVFFSEKNDQELSIMLGFFCIVILLAAYTIFLNVITQAYQKSENNVYKLAIYGIVFTAAFVGLFIELNVYDFGNHAITALVPPFIATFFALLMAREHYPYVIKKDLRYSMLNENSKDDNEQNLIADTQEQA